MLRDSSRRWAAGIAVHRNLRFALPLVGEESGRAARVNGRPFRGTVARFCARRPRQRFQNKLKWARSLVCFVKDPQANDGSFVEPFRVNLAFKWILEFEDELASWQRLLDIVETSLHFVRWEGYFRGAQEHLQTRLTPLQGNPLCVSNIIDAKSAISDQLV